MMCSTIVNNHKHTAFGPSQEMKPTNPDDGVPLEEVKKALFKNYLDQPINNAPTEKDELISDQILGLHNPGTTK